MLPYLNELITSIIFIFTSKNQHDWEINQRYHDNRIFAHRIHWWPGATRILCCILLSDLPDSTDGEPPHHYSHHHWPASPVAHVFLPKEFVLDWYLLHLCHCAQIHHKLSDQKPFHLFPRMCLTNFSFHFFGWHRVCPPYSDVLWPLCCHLPSSVLWDNHE